MRLALAALLLAAAGCGGTAAPAPEAPRAAAELVLPPPFVPPTYREGGSEVVPVTFPDGSTAEIVYERGLEFAAKGIQPYTWALLDTDAGSIGRDFTILHGPREEVWQGDPVQTYEGANGSVVALYQEESERRDYLAFEFGSWTVSFDDDGRLSDEERRTWARSLTGHETEDGFLVLEARSPLRLARAGEYPAPMQLWFGSPGEGLVIWPVEKCSPKQRFERSREYASWCDRDARMYVGVEGEKSFVDRVLATGIAIRNVSIRAA